MSLSLGGRTKQPLCVRPASGGRLLSGGCGRRASEPEAATRGWGSPRFGCEAGRRPAGWRAVWRAPVGPEAPTRERCAASNSYSAPEEVRPFGQRQPLSASLPNTTAVDQATALGGARKAVLSARRSVGRWPLGRTQARAGEVPGSALRSKRMRLPQTKKRRARPPVVRVFVLLDG